MSKVEYNAVALKRAAILNDLPAKSNACQSDLHIVQEYDIYFFMAHIAEILKVMALYFLYNKMKIAMLQNETMP